MALQAYSREAAGNFSAGHRYKREGDYSETVGRTMFVHQMKCGLLILLYMFIDLTWTLELILTCRAVLLNSFGVSGCTLHSSRILCTSLVFPLAAAAVRALPASIWLRTIIVCLPACSERDVPQLRGTQNKHDKRERKKPKLRLAGYCRLQLTLLQHPANVSRSSPLTPCYMTPCLLFGSSAGRFNKAYCWTTQI